MNIILFGPPGVGKGTQADNIVKNFNLYKISTGALLREETKKSTDLGKKIKTKIDQGFLVSYEEAQKTRFGELLERYRREITSKKKSNETEDYKIKYLQTLPICDNYLISITPTKIAKLRDSLLADRKPGTVCKYLAFISNCWNVARKEWGINLPDNPVSLIKKPVVKDRRDRILTPEEYKRLLDACSLSKLYSMKGMANDLDISAGKVNKLIKEIEKEKM